MEALGLEPAAVCELGRLAGLVSASGGDPARPAPDLAPLDYTARRALLTLQVAPCFPGNPSAVGSNAQPGVCAFC